MANKVVKVCPTCGREFTSNNISKHAKVCSLRGPTLSEEELREKRREQAKYARSKITENSRDKMSRSVQRAHKRGCYSQYHSRLRGSKGKPHTESTKSLLSEKAKNSPHRRLKKNPLFYRGVMMDSSWEVKLAEWLDHRLIEWIRPKPLKYDSVRNYFPDFYLPEFNLYLDTKNDYLIKFDSDKVRKAASQNNVKIVILSKQMLKELGVL